jgi:hypothetical protein
MSIPMDMPPMPIPISKITTKVLNTSSSELSNQLPYLELKSSDTSYAAKEYKITTNDLLEYLDLMNKYENIKLYFDFSEIDLSEIFAKLPNVKSLVLSSNNPVFTQPNVYYNDSIQIYPAKLEKLVFSMKICKDKITSSSDWNNNIALLPSTLKHLSLLGYTDPLPILPSGLKSLVLGEHFNQPVDNLPNSLEKLYLGEQFDKTLYNLPNSLEELHLGDYFNQPLDNLPYSLKKLYIKSSFFKFPVDNLPIGLEILQLGYMYREPMNNLPITLKYLDIISFISPKPRTLNTLPDSIEHLVMDFTGENIDKLPANLKILEYIANDDSDFDNSDFNNSDFDKIYLLEEKYPNVTFKNINDS